MFAIVDETEDDALNYKEFKKCALSNKANQIFSEIMKEVEINKTEIEKINHEEFVDMDRKIVKSEYIPRRFPAMITYMSYLINRN
jgi:hypothetical protein